MIPGCGTAADDGHFEKVDETFTGWAKPGLPGASLVIVKDGKIIYTKGYGAATMEYDVPVTPDTVFHVASVSKQFTAMAVLLLEQRGKLSLNDDIRKHLPEMPDYGKTITIRHLLNHTSGLRDQWELLAMAGWRLDDVITREQILDMVKHQKELNFPPGEQYLYCNTGYTLAAEIVTRVSGKSFREWTAENIFKPLGMKNTHFHDDHEMIVKNRAYSYYLDNNKQYKRSVLNYANVGATSLFTTAPDMAKWVLNLENPRFGGEELKRKLVTRGVLNNGEKIDYCLGITRYHHRGMVTFAHGGADAGFRSNMTYFPGKKFGVVVLSNLGSSNTTKLAKDVADIFLADGMNPKEKKKETKKRKEIKINPALLDDYVGYFQLAHGDVVVFTKKDNRLLGQATGQERVEFLPESKTKFFVKIADVQVVFHREKPGKVERLTLQVNGRKIKATRIQPVEVTPALIADYCGDYYSDELGTFYSILHEGGNFKARHRRHGDISLLPGKKDKMIGGKWFFHYLHFQRDENGKVTGFRLSHNRVKNLLFTRKPR